MTDEELLQAIEADKRQAVPVSDADLLARIEADKQADPENPLWHGVKLFGSAAVRGAGETLGTISDLAGQASAGMAGPRLLGQTQYDPNPLKEEIENFGTQARPGSKLDQYVEAAGKGVGGALALPIPAGRVAGTPGRAALSTIGRIAETGAASGAGAQLGEDVFKNETYGPIIGALLGGGAAGMRQYYSGHKSNNLRDLAKYLTEDRSPEQLDAAARAFDQARDVGVDITLDQALPGARTKWAGSYLSDSPTGQRTQGVLQNQPGQIVEGMDREIASLGGRRIPAQQAEDLGQLTATQDANRFVGRQTAQFGRRAGGSQKIQLMQDELARVNAMVENAAIEKPGLRREFDAIRQAINNPDIQTLEQLDDTFKFALARASEVDPLMGGAPRAGAAYLKEKIGQIRKEVNEFYAPEYQEARRRMAETAGPARDRLKKSAMGRIAAGGAEPDQEGNRVLWQIFSKGTPSLDKQSEIRFVAKRMNRINPEAFRTGVTSYMADMVSRAIVRSGDTYDPSSISRLNQAFFGTEAKVQGLKDMLYGVAQGHGMKNPQDMYNGFVNFMQTTNRIAKRVQPSGQAGLEGAEIAAKSKLGTAARFPYFGNFAAWADRFYTKNTMQQLDNLFSSKEGLETLQKLAKEPTGSPRSQAIIRAWVVGQNTQGEESEIKE